MIRLVTIADGTATPGTELASPFDPADITFICRTLFQAYGLGTEFSGVVPVAKEARGDDGRFDAEALLEKAPAVRSYADDKLIFIAPVPLALKGGPLGEPPCWGFAQYGGRRALVSTSKLPNRGATEASIETWRKRLGREAIHTVGHLWDLHHCYDPRCSMHPSWSPNLAANPEMGLCTFCREKSEQRIRLAKT